MPYWNRLFCYLSLGITGLIALLIMGAPLQAQIYTGSIAGTITDPSGASIPGATVTLTEQRTGVERKVNSQANGNFVFTGLDAGEYTLRVESSGFASLERRNTILPTGERLGLGSIALELGTVAEVVSVEGQAAIVKTESAERSSTITSEQVSNLLVINRNVPSLMQLIPGVVMNREEDSLTRRVDFSSNGGRVNTNTVAVDGVMSSDVRNGFALKLQISQEAVSEVHILQNNYQAEFGRKSGAVVNMVTKSGTQQFHGMFSYFKRHEQFNAMNFFDNRRGITTKPRHRYNTYTYNIGGPVFIPKKWNTSRDKMFFFWNQEFWPISNTHTFTRTVPTGPERQGDFSQTLYTNGNQVPIFDPYNGGAPFPGNRIPSDRLDPSGIALLKFFPEANFFDRGVSNGRYNYVFSAEENLPNRTDTLKLDYNFNANNRISGTYTTFDEKQEGYVFRGYFVGNWPHMPLTFTAANRGVTTRYTKVVSPTIINEFKFSWFENPEKLTTTDDGLAGVQRSNIGFTAGQLYPSANPEDIVPRARFGGIPSAADIRILSRFPMDDPYNLFTWDDKVSIVSGSHLVKLGIFFQWAGHGMTSPVERFGSFLFNRNVNNPLDTNWAYSNAALGVYQTYEEANRRPVMKARNFAIHWYAQDTWKVTPRFVLDYGMRFYWVRPTHHAEDLLSGFVPSRFDSGAAVHLLDPAFDDAGERVAVDAATGQFYPSYAIGAVAPGSGDPFNGMVSPSIDNSFPRGMYENQGVQFAPRVGFSWDLFGDGKTALRGGVGIFYNPLVDAQIQNLSVQPPLIEKPVLYYGEMSKLSSAQGLSFPSAIRGFDPQDHMPSAVNYSFGVQRDIGFNTVLDVSYVASLGRHLSWRRNLNSIPFGANFDPANEDPTKPGKPLPANFLRPYPGYGNLLFRESAGSSNFHSLQVTANRRFARGVQFGVSYTFGKALDFVTGDFSPVSNLVPARQRDYGLSDFDRTHIVKINYLADIPKVPWDNIVAKAVLHNWQVLGITSFVSGQPLSVGYGTTKSIDITGSPTDGARIDLLSDPYLPQSERSFSRNFRTEAFALPAVGTIGNAGKHQLRGPGINNWDIALFKNIPIRESMRIQIRWETYNTFNHTQFASFDTGALFDTATGAQVDPGFGEFTSARAPRRMQFGLRFQF